MKSLLHITAAIFALVVVSTQGKPVNSGLQNDSSVKNSTTNSTKDSISKAKNKTEDSTSSKNLVLAKNISLSKTHGHNNLLSDLARISQDSGSTSKSDATKSSSHEFKPTNKTKIVKFVAQNSSHSSSAPRRSDVKASTETSVTSPSTEVVSTEDSSDADGSTVTETFSNPENEKKNEQTEFKLSEPTHLVFNNDTNDGKPFSKLITSNDNAPPENNEQSNDGVIKTQELSPLISDRNENTPEPTPSNGMVNNVGQQNVYQVTPTETKKNDNVNTNGDVNGNTYANFNTDDNSNTDTNANVNYANANYADVNAGTSNKEEVIDQTSTFGGNNDTLNFKDITVEYNETKHDKSAESVIVCPGAKQTISCPSDSTINVTSASYGYDSDGGCGGPTTLPSCQANGVYPVVRSACQGQPSCLLQSDGQDFGGNCPGSYNYLKVGYLCQNDQPSLLPSQPPPQPPPLPSPPPSPPPPLPPPTSPYSYQAAQTSPYIPHPVSGQPATSSYYNDYYKTNGYNYNGYYNNKNPHETNYRSGYNNNNNRGYYNNYYDSQSRQSQPTNYGDYYRYNNNPGSRRRQPPPRYPTPPLPPPPPPPPPHARNAYTNWLNYQDSVMRRYQDSLSNSDSYNSPENTRYYNQNYYSSPLTQFYPQSQYPRNSYTGSCYACQSCQECSAHSYCQGCTKCKSLNCNKKRPVKQKLMDPIDILIEEFGRKTQGMTPMEMSGVIISPVPKFPFVAAKSSSPLKSSPKVVEEDNDSDEDEFEDESGSGSANDGENEDYESDTVDQASKKSFLTSSHSRGKLVKHKATRKQRKEREKSSYYKKSVRRTKQWEPSRLFKHYNNDDDDDVDDFQHFNKKELKRNKHHKPSKYFDDDGYSNNGEEESKRFTKRWNVDDDSPEINEEQNYLTDDDYIDEDTIDKYGRLFW